MPRTVVLLNEYRTLKALASNFMMASQVSLAKRQQPLVMVVEDNEDSMIIVDYLLDSLGCRAICEIDGTRVLQLARNYQPSIILMDIMLPGISGIDVFHQLQQDPLTSSIPVVAMTALAMVEDRERIQKAGFHSYVTKPYLLEELEQVVIHHLQRVGAFCSHSSSDRVAS